jgi:hypothetical protein
MRFLTDFFRAFFAISLLVAAATTLRGDLLPLAVAPENATAKVMLPHVSDLVFPGECNFVLQAPHATNWLDGTAIRVMLVWPSNAPARSGSLVWLKDRDDYWHQYLSPEFLKPGATNTLTIPFQSGAIGWQTPGHSLAWHHRVRLNPQSVGLRVFSDTAFTGKCVLVSATLETQSDRTPPTIAKVTPLTRDARALALYELCFDLPDRYDNPFDPSQIDAGAQISGPDGTTNTVNAFYYIPHYRLEDEVGEPVEPDGPPEWRIRYCPRKPGTYTVSLYARDATGETRATHVLSFTAAPAAPDALRFVRVSNKDRRYFEFDDGSLFYPVGHNVRSATDSRMDDKFPWIFRKEEGSTAYRRYFKRMQDAGENMGEVWMSAWSLGLEWTEGIGGYHGANDFHMGNAWELDRVMELARQHRIHLNLVLNYHGRISTWLDAEWHLHPYNKATPGGWLEKPLEFFSDPRAIEMQKRFCRYTQARWGWSSAILGYELCSEINLTGPYFDDGEKEFRQRTHFKPAVVEWCRLLGGYIKTIDPYGHLVSAHVSNDYSILNPALCNLPEMDFNPLDAYNNGAPETPERIIALAVGTANAGQAYNKPILITEFGGSAMAANLENLKIEQHAALWSGACLPLAGVPMFWWWQVVDENNLYVRYTAVRRFMENVDPRDTSAKPVNVELSVPEGGDKKLPQAFDALGTASPEKARGYIYPKRFARTGETVPETGTLTASIDGFTPGIFRVEFFETETGKSVRRFDVRTKDNKLEIPVPPFKGDCAFKVNLLTPVAKK